MRLLLDTHVVLWWLAESPQLPSGSRTAIARCEAAHVSAATAWEIAIKKARGKLEAPDDFEKALKANRFDPLPVTVAHAWAAGALPRHHEDPFDRMLVAQARIEGLTLMTRDRRIASYDVRILLV